MVDNPSTFRLTKIRLTLDAGRMTTKPSTFIEIIDLYEDPPLSGKRPASRPPSTGVKRLAARLGYPEKRVYKWRSRNIIGLSYWGPVLEAVRSDHGIHLTFADLYAMRMAQRQVAQEAA
jgi:hypothetical protein